MLLLRPAVQVGVSTTRRRVAALYVTKSRVSALTLLVTQVFADDHNATVTADNLALVADLLNARVDLHRVSSVTSPKSKLELGNSDRVVVTCSGRQFGHGTSRMGLAQQQLGPQGGYECSVDASFPKCAQAPCDRWSIPP